MSLFNGNTGESIQDILNELNRSRLQRVQEWQDRGGGSMLLTLILIIISTYHIVMVLAKKDPLIVAVSVAVVCDWGLFNFVSFLLKERFTAREKIAAGFTFLLAAAAAFYSVKFHLRYYDGDWFLALFTPFSIILLSWTSYRQRRRYEQKQEEPKQVEPKREPKQEQEQEQEQEQDTKQVEPKQRKPKAITEKITSRLVVTEAGVSCPVCGKTAASAKALQGSGHSIARCLDSKLQEE